VICCCYILVVVQCCCYLLLRYPIVVVTFSVVVVDIVNILIQCNFPLPCLTLIYVTLCRCSLRAIRSLRYGTFTRVRGVALGTFVTVFTVTHPGTFCCDLPFWIRLRTLFGDAIHCYRVAVVARLFTRTPWMHVALPVSLPLLFYACLPFAARASDSFTVRCILRCVSVALLLRVTLLDFPLLRCRLPDLLRVWVTTRCDFGCNPTPLRTVRSDFVTWVFTVLLRHMRCGACAIFTAVNFTRCVYVSVFVSAVALLRYVLRLTGCVDLFLTVVTYAPARCARYRAFAILRSACVGCTFPTPALPTFALLPFAFPLRYAFDSARALAPRHAFAVAFAVVSAVSRDVRLYGSWITFARLRLHRGFVPCVDVYTFDYVGAGVPLIRCRWCYTPLPRCVLVRR